MIKNTDIKTRYTTSRYLTSNFCFLEKNISVPRSEIPLIKSNKKKYIKNFFMFESLYTNTKIKLATQKEIKEIDKRST